MESWEQSLVQADGKIGIRIDSASGALTPVSGSPFPAGNHPAVLAVANNFLYVVNEQDGSIPGLN